MMEGNAFPHTDRQYRAPDTSTELTWRWKECEEQDYKYATIISKGHSRKDALGLLWAQHKQIRKSKVL